MKWVSAISQPKGKQANLQTVLAQCCTQIKEELAKPDLVIGFVSPHFIDNFEQVPPLVHKALNPKTFIGCSAGGIIGGGLEIEQEPAVALIAAQLPNVEIKSFHIETANLPDLDDSPSKWETLVGVSPSVEPSFILLPDPFTFRIDSFVQGLDFAFPKSTKVGGLASSARQPNENVLFLNKNCYRAGLVGLALSGDVLIESVVAQGCRPIGKPMRVTNCHQNLLYELEGKPAVVVLHDLLEQLSKPDQELARRALFLGLVMDEFQESFKPGDFLIRNILGIEPNTGGLVIGEVLRNERTVQFHVRDADASADDLQHLLQSYSETHEKKAEGALLFSCLGRGQYLYGHANHDSDCFRKYLGEIPLAGFFCNGEIGPVGGTTFLHGYTSSFGIIRKKTKALI
jgi:small ligand-binding sensory domain FIST